ncbi:MAG: pyroglutamyl-peptidase I [Acidobacteria bacterium]|nr:pyroglutamyl-peptidase I [Acidobacteriota bacterium]
MKILVTGFNSFRGVPVNPSEQVVRALAERSRRDARAELVTAVLATEYVAGTKRLRRLIRTVRPDAILCLGVALRRESISLERVALNLDDDSTPDNAGLIRQGRKIAPRGPDVYWSTLPLEALQKALQRRGIKASVSNHAGTFLCNHAFYVARQETAPRRRIPCGFIHLPGAGGRQRGALLRRFVQAIECCLQVIRKEKSRGKLPVRIRRG